MSNITNVNPTTLSHVSDSVLGTKAVTDAANLGVSLFLQVFHGQVHNWLDLVNRMVGDPSWEIEVVWSLEGQSITAEQVWHNGEVSIGSVLVGNQFAVLPNADNIWEEEDGLLLVDLALWLSNVGLDVVELDQAACSLASVSIISILFGAVGLAMLSSWGGGV